MRDMHPYTGIRLSVGIVVAKPVCCKIPRYGIFESEVKKKLCNRLRDNYMVDD